MAQFIGSAEHSLDAKGRLVLPVKFRAQLADGAFLTKYFNGCLALWTPDAFSDRLSKLLANQDRSTAERNMARFWTGGSEEVKPDAQGRVPIAPYLKTYAQLDAQVLVSGAGDRVEIWSPQRWADISVPAEEAMTNPTDPAPAGAEG